MQSQTSSCVCACFKRLTTSSSSTRRAFSYSTTTAASSSASSSSGSSSSSSSTPLLDAFRSQDGPLLSSFEHVPEGRMRQGMLATQKMAALAAGARPERLLRSTSASGDGSLTSSLHAKKTYEIAPLEDPLVAFMTNLMMRDGKKATARKHVSTVLETLRKKASSPPLPILKEAIRLASPYIRIAQQKNRAKNVSVPLSLGERQRVHRAIRWILDASDKRTNPNAGGSKVFGERVALEIEAVLNGSSEVLKKKEQLHTMATVNRANVKR